MGGDGNSEIKTSEEREIGIIKRKEGEKERERLRERGLKFYIDNAHSSYSPGWCEHYTHKRGWNN